MSQIFKCSNCNSYTLDSERCPKCGNKVSSPKPARFSMDDKYGKYRREAKRKSRS